MSNSNLYFLNAFLRSEGMNALKNCFLTFPNFILTVTSGVVSHTASRGKFIRFGSSDK